MSKVVAAIALAGMLASPAFAQPDVRYYNTIPSSRAPSLTSNPSPRDPWAGDFIPGDPDPRMNSAVLR